MKNSNIRAVSPKDLTHIKNIIEATAMFPVELLDEMISPFFKDPSSKEIWLTYEVGRPIAVVYSAPERMTSGTWNLLLIAVSPEYQGQGIGTELMTYIEHKLHANDENILLVETSGMAEFELTRKFYLNNNYVKEAVIRDFYAKGDDKVVFWKLLQS